MIRCKLAFRNIFRFKRRTFITLLASSFGLALLVVAMALLDGIDSDSQSSIINAQTSHLNVFKEGYYEKRHDYPIEPAITEAENYSTTLAAIPGVRAVSSRILFAATLIRQADELPCLGVGVDTGLDPQVFNIRDSLQEGSWLEAGDRKILVGRDLAGDLGVSVGDLLVMRLVLFNEEEEFTWNAIDVEVKGIFASGNPQVDRGRIFMPLSLAREGLGLESRVTELVIRLENDSDSLLASVQTGIKKILDRDARDLQVYSWKEMASGFLAVSRMKTRNSGIIILVMLLIASVGIVNTMLMTVLERTREIGMLAALGLKKREIMWLFILEGGFIGLIGSFLGCLLGGLASWYLEVKGVSLRAFGETMVRMSESIYPVKDVFYADLSFRVLLLVFLFGTVLALLASAYPARKAANLDPIIALRHI